MNPDRENRRTKRRIIWFTLPPVMCLFCCCGGCFGFGTLQLWRWDQAAAPFREVGGYPHDSADGGSRWFGADGLHGATLVGRHITDETLERLRPHMERLPNFHRLVLNETSVTDVGLDHVRNLKLSYLDLSGTQVTAAGLRKLKGMEFRKLGSDPEVIVPGRISDEEIAELRDGLPDVPFVKQDIRLEINFGQNESH